MAGLFFSRERPAMAAGGAWQKMSQTKAAISTDAAVALKSTAAAAPATSTEAAAPPRASDTLALKLSSSEFTTTLSHFHRAEIARMAGWRDRLDRTSNWAITVVAAMLSVSLSTPSAHHGVPPLLAGAGWGAGASSDGDSSTVPPNAALARSTHALAILSCVALSTSVCHVFRASLKY